MADVNLFGGRGGAARGGVVGVRRVAVRVVVYKQTDRQRFVDSRGR